MRAAASSSARGRLSRRAQSSSTASDLRASGSSARARVRNSATPSSSASVGTAYTCSPWSWSRSRLVTRIFGPGTSRRRAISLATSGSRCSALSRRSNARMPSSRSATLSASSRPGCCSTWSGCASEEVSRRGSRSGAIPTHHRPSGNVSAASAAACSASRDFPVPPGPVSVSSRAPSRRSATTSSTSCVAPEERGRGHRQVGAEEALERREGRHRRAGTRARTPPGP